MNNELTSTDIKRMEEEIEYRKVVVRKELLAAVKVAREQGDLSENFEYYAAKKEKNINEGRIRFLDRMIRTAIVVSEDSKEDEVGINNIVEVYIAEDKTTVKYKLVTTMRGDSVHGLISTESPMGKALLGHKVGDKVSVKVNDSYSYEVEVKTIENSIDDGSDKLRDF